MKKYLVLVELYAEEITPREAWENATEVFLLDPGARPEEVEPVKEELHGFKAPRKHIYPCNVNVTNFSQDSNTFPSPFVLDLPKADYTFIYSYPLRRKATFTHLLTNKTTALEILEMAADDYRRIYEMDERYPASYGIWGHVIGDLFFEEIQIDTGTREVQFRIGS